MDRHGWIKLHRRFIDWEWFTDRNVLQVFIYLLADVNHTEKKWKGHLIQRGQTATSINTISKNCKLSPMQVRTAIKKLISTGEITSKTTNSFTLITVENYDMYQSKDNEDNEQRNEQRNIPITNEQQTDNKRITTNKNDKNNKNEKEEIYSPAEAEQITAYMNKKWGTNYKPTTRATVSLIQARINEGFTVEDFIKVIDTQTAEWKHDSKMKKYLRPQTLFTGKFESYLNSEVSREAEKKRLAEEAGEIMEKGGTVW